jgi:DNA-binding ferritin-like protein
MYIILYKVDRMLKKINMTKKRKNFNGTRRNRNTSTNNGIYANFEREITMIFFEMILLIKLYHWKTYSYATHKATDDLYTKLNENMDKFMEVLLGKTGMRIDLIRQKSIPLYDLTNSKELIQKVNKFKNYLVNLHNHKAMKLMSNMDLLTIRDEILADMNQFLYLLSFK